MAKRLEIFASVFGCEGGMFLFLDFAFLFLPISFSKSVHERNNETRAKGCDFFLRLAGVNESHFLGSENGLLSQWHYEDENRVVSHTRSIALD